MKKIWTGFFMCIFTLLLTSCVYDENQSDYDFFVGDESSFTLALVENRIKERFDTDRLIPTLTSRIKRIQETSLHLAEDRLIEYSLQSILEGGRFSLGIYYIYYRTFNPWNYAFEVNIVKETEQEYDFQIFIRIISPATFNIERTWSAFQRWVVNVDGVDILGYHECQTIGSNSPYIEFNYMYKPIERYERAVTFGLTFANIFQYKLTNGEISLLWFLGGFDPDIRVKREAAILQIVNEALNTFVIDDYYFTISNLVVRVLSRGWTWYGVDARSNIWWGGMIVYVDAPNRH